MPFVTTAPVFDRMANLADPTRGRLLLALERRELSVGELCAVLQMPQSTVSRHLKVLGDDGWVVARREGTSRQYALEPDELDAAGRDLWQLVRGEVAGLSAAGEDTRRLAAVLAERRARSREFFSGVAGRWEGLRRELYGSAADASALLGLLDESWTVGDLGCGTGRLAAALAPFVRRVVAVDGSEAMLEEAGATLGGLANVERRCGELESLPVADGELDAAVLMLVLHHVADPARALAEVARVLVPGGRVLIVDMAPHERREYRQEMGHLWLGFADEQLRSWMEPAGLRVVASRPLSPDPHAKGPALFALTARRTVG